ncbi:MAG: type II secretion system protein GspN [Deltaproteobacteria bacterium]|nr:type II secretion system protein GspN [Deltaproteobacteria bacterium]
MNHSEEQTQEITSPTLIFARLSLGQKILRVSLWTLLTILLLIFFTYWKLPETRLKNFIYGNISSALNAQGITLSALQTTLSIGVLGLDYEMKDVSINFPSLDHVVQVDHISISPSLMPFLWGNLGGSLEIKQGDGTAAGKFSLNQKKSTINSDFVFKNFNLSKSSLFELAFKIKGGGLLNGKLKFSGALVTPETWIGDVRLKLSKIKLEPQFIVGFSVPELNLSEGVIEFDVQNKVASVKNIKLGKNGLTSDDIQGMISGEMQLGKTLDASTLKLKTKFGFSQNIQKAFVLLDALMGVAKQSDGNYAYRVEGLFSSPQFVPGNGS